MLFSRLDKIRRDWNLMGHISFWLVLLLMYLVGGSINIIKNLY